jgi:membrane associated rhomboid family serine protease
MDEFTLIVAIIMGSTGYVTYLGLEKRAFFNGHAFNVDGILTQKEYKRMISSGLLHADWMHFAFNMLTLYFFGPILEQQVGPIWFLGIYLISLIGGNLFSLYIHRNHGNYTAIGASGAVSGVVFACIAMFPDMQLGLLFLPFYIPSWAFGLLYVGYSIYGIKSSRDNIGHEAHLGGGVIGLLVALAHSPHLLTQNQLPILLILVPSFIFLILVIYKPEILLLDRGIKRHVSKPTKDEQFNLTKAHKQREIDALLDKINAHGIDSLSPWEKNRFEELTSE